MNATRSTKIKNRTIPNDTFYTPTLVAKTHINSIHTITGDKWLDPFYGKGVYYDHFPVPENQRSFTEISLDKDFFEYTKPVDIICSNPPYSIIDRVITKSIDLNPRIISYLLLEGKLTPRRIKLFNDNGYGLTGMYICKVFNWYGMSVAYTFTRGCENHANITYDRIVHK